MKTSIFLVVTACFGQWLHADPIDPRQVAMSERAVKLRSDFKDALSDACPKLGISPDGLEDILSNLYTMAPREGLLNPWRQSNKYLHSLPENIGGVSRDEFPAMLEVREGILIIEKAKAGENISLTAFYSTDITDPEQEREAVKNSKDLARNSSWSYRFVFRSRIKAGSNRDVTTMKPIFLLKYTNEIPQHIRVLNDAMVYIRGTLSLDQNLEVVTRKSGVFGADDLRLNELVIDQRNNSSVFLNGGAVKIMEAVVDDKASLLAGDLEADKIEMNLSRGSCKEVVVNPRSRLIVIGDLKRKQGTFTSVNPDVEEEDGSVLLRNLKNVGKGTASVVSRSVKAVSLGAGWITWKVVSLPFRMVGALFKRLAGARVGVGTSFGVGPMRVGVGTMF